MFPNIISHEQKDNDDDKVNKLYNVETYKTNLLSSFRNLLYVRR